MIENETRSRRRLWSGVIAVFIAGVIIGGLGATALMRSHFMHVMRSPHPRPHERIAGRLTANLGLTGAQRAQVDAIIREFDPRFDEFEQRSRLEVRNIAGEMEERIRGILTPDQQAKYDVNVQKIREEFRMRDEETQTKGPKE
jgi:Spy/CpxP family protein refolding chaperone